MIQCQNCGQVNNDGSNFCRFCGSRMVMPQQQSQNVQPPPPPFEYRTPRPYVWKTDEFQVNDLNDKKTRQINQVQPLANLAPPQALRPPQLQQQQQHPVPFYQPSQPPAMTYGYRCPRCGTQNLPWLTRKISAAGWVVFAVLLVMFFPLFWIGFLIKEDVKICSVCGIKVG
jgi:RNA polymerase subunit RPABC4/transcription elongation factor Spt4